ncbi:MAG: hypothetical protein IPM91_02905 [Bacteroidetes bacterium]|nr:hypothetical protein [Bacteroidota bacterium]
MARKNLSQKTALKTTVRLTMVAAAAAAAGLVMLLIVIFNLSNDEEGRAQSSMTFKQAITTQDTTRILRGSINQQIIGVMIETSGKGTPLKVNSITFSAKGTSLPVENNVENARLWYTGNDPEFSLQQTVGTTVLKITDQSFLFSGNMALLPGRNYFWLTMDVKPEAATGPGMIDAACHEIRIGAIAYQPTISDPMGKRFTQANIPFYSMGSMSLAKVSSWNSKRDGSGVAPRQMSESRNSYFIQAGHRMISSTGSNIQTLVVEKGGELRITSPLRLNAMYVACGGVLQMDTTINDYYSFVEFYMDNASMYIHNSEGVIPGKQCYFAPGSGQVFFKYGPNTFRNDIAFGNLSIDAADATTSDFGGKIENIQGDFEIRRTGAGDAGIVFSGNNTLNIGGSFQLTGGKFFGAQQGTLECIVADDFILKGADFTDSKNAKLNGNLKMKVNGDVIFLNGTFNTSVHPQSEMILSGFGSSRWIQKPTCEVVLGNINLSEKRKLVIKGDQFGTIAAGRTFNVNQGGELMCEQVIIQGKGTFHLDDKSLLGIGHPDGIYSKGNMGNIQTAIRKFHSGSTYYYYTSSEPQQTGVFTTYPKENAVYRLIINKAHSSQVLNLSQSISVDDQCKINLGDLRF